MLMLPPARNTLHVIKPPRPFRRLSQLGRGCGRLLSIIGRRPQSLPISLVASGHGFDISWVAAIYSRQASATPRGSTRLPADKTRVPAMRIINARRGGRTTAPARHSPGTHRRHHFLGSHFLSNAADQRLATWPCGQHDQ